MHLSALEVRDLRILGGVSLTPGLGLNVLAGPNGSGKTSLLESIHLLGTGRSFRTRRPGELVRRGAEGFLVRGEDGEGISVGIEHGRGKTRIRRGGADVQRASDLARHLPLVVLSPDSHRLLTDGAGLRRGLVDWAMFHVERDYGEWHGRYRRALRQRNQALRAGGPLASVGLWDREVAESGERIQAVRKAYVASVLPAFERFLGSLMAFPVGIGFSAGWDENAGLEAVLAVSAEADRQRGFTRFGPHRADLELTVEGTKARDVLSRGEGKLLVAGLMLAQAAYLVESVGVAPVVLVDEVASELDAESRARIFDALASLRTQSFVTTVSRDLVDARHLDGAKVFHVERGTTLEVV